MFINADTMKERTAVMMVRNSMNENDYNNRKITEENNERNLENNHDTDSNTDERSKKELKEKFTRIKAQELILTMKVAEQLEINIRNSQKQNQKISTAVTRKSEKNQKIVQS